MSIELNTSRMLAAISRVQLAQAAVSMALRDLDQAERDIAAEMAFGNDPQTTDGQVLVVLAAETGEFTKALLMADCRSPHCGDAIHAIGNITARKLETGSHKALRRMPVDTRLSEDAPSFRELLSSPCGVPA